MWKNNKTRQEIIDKIKKYNEHSVSIEQDYLVRECKKLNEECFGAYCKWIDHLIHAQKVIFGESSGAESADARQNFIEKFSELNKEIINELF